MNKKVIYIGVDVDDKDSMLPHCFQKLAKF